MRDIFPKLDVGNNPGLMHKVFNYSSHWSSRNKSTSSLWRWNIWTYPGKQHPTPKAFSKNTKCAWHLFTHKLVKGISRKVKSLFICTTGIIILKDNYYLGLENSFSCFSQLMHICLSYIDFVAYGSQRSSKSHTDF